MLYEEFDKKYNKRDYRGVILEASIITLDGKVLKRGSLEELEDFWDNNVEIIWENHKVTREEINGEEAIWTNIGKGDAYSNRIMNKIRF